MNKILIAVSLGFALMTLVSALLWAAFDYSWWEPIGPGSARGPALLFLHFVGFLQPLMVLMFVDVAEVTSRTSAAGS